MTLKIDVDRIQFGSKIMRAHVLPELRTVQG